jgi:hypothetical protein
MQFLQHLDIRGVRHAVTLPSTRYHHQRMIRDGAQKETCGAQYCEVLVSYSSLRQARLNNAYPEDYVLSP